MALGLSIMNEHFDSIRRGVKKFEYRPYCKFYHQRFLNKHVGEIDLSNQMMRDHLLVRCDIDTGRLPDDLHQEWHRLYKKKMLKEPEAYSPEKVYRIQIIGIPKYYVAQKHFHLPVRFS